MTLRRLEGVIVEDRFTGELTIRHRWCVRKLEIVKGDIPLWLSGARANDRVCAACGKNIPLLDP